MSMISMAVFDTDENKRTGLTIETVESLFKTVDFTKHRLVVSDNGSCKETHDYYEAMRMAFPDDSLIIIYNNENLGTAEAINKAWRLRKPGEHCVKMDNDVVIHQVGWVDELEQAIERQPAIGLIALKRKDVWQTPHHPDENYRSQYVLLPHESGQRWITVEQTSDIIGTCVMHNSALLDKVGYLKQPGAYGYDDTIMSWRSHLSGFMNCFLPHIEIDHIDPGNTPYQSWKEKHAGEHTTEMINYVHGMMNGNISLYYNPFE